MVWLALLALLSLSPPDEDLLDRHAADAAAAMKSGNFASAEQHYRAVIRLRPQMAEADVNLGLSCFLQGKYNEAVRALETGLKLNPGMANAKLFLGISRFKLNQPAVALPILRQYAAGRPDDAQGQYYLGLTYLTLGKYSDSERVLLAARKLDPRNVDVLYHLTQSYLNQARENAAKRDEMAKRYHDTVEEIAAIDPDSYRLAQLRAGFFEADGKKADAIRELEALVRQQPKLRGLHYTLGCLYTEAREYPKALAQFQAELKLGSPYPRTYLQLGHVYVALEQPEQALPLLRKAAVMEPESSGLVWVDIGRAYRLQNRPDQEAAAFEKAISLGEAKASVYYQLAVAAKKSGNAERSRQALEMSQKLRREEQAAGPVSTQ